MWKDQRAEQLVGKSKCKEKRKKLKTMQIGDKRDGKVGRYKRNKILQMH